MSDTTTTPEATPSPAEEPAPRRRRFRLPGSGRGPGGSPLFRNAYALMLNTGISAVLGLGFWLAAAHYYAESAVGQGSAAIAAMKLLAGLTAVTLTGALARFIPVAGRTTMRLIVGTYAASSLVVALAAGVFLLTLKLWGPSYRFLHDPANALFFVLAVVAWSVLTLQDGVLTGLRNAVWVPVGNTVFSAVKLVLLVLLAAAIPTMGVFVSWVAAIAVSVLPLGWLVFRRLVPRHVAATEDHARPPTPREIGRFLAGDYTGSLFSLAVVYLVPVIVAARVSSEDNAYFYIAATIGSTVNLLAINMGASLTVEGSHDPGRLAANTRAALRRMTRIMLPVCVLMFAGAPWILGVFGGGYADAATPLLRWFAVGALLRVVMETYFAVLRAQSRTAGLAWLQGLLCTLVLGLTVLLLPRMGLAGAGVAEAVSVAVIAAIALPRLLSVVRSSPSVPEDTAPDGDLADLGTNENTLALRVGGRRRGWTGDDDTLTLGVHVDVDHLERRPDVRPGPGTPPQGLPAVTLPGPRGHRPAWARAPESGGRAEPEDAPPGAGGDGAAPDGAARTRNGAPAREGPGAAAPPKAGAPTHEETPAPTREESGAPGAPPGAGALGAGQTAGVSSVREGSGVSAREGAVAPAREGIGSVARDGAGGTAGATPMGEVDRAARSGAAAGTAPVSGAQEAAPAEGAQETAPAGVALRKTAVTETTVAESPVTRTPGTDTPRTEQAGTEQAVTGSAVAETAAEEAATAGPRPRTPGVRQPPSSGEPPRGSLLAALRPSRAGLVLGGLLVIALALYWIPAADLTEADLDRMGGLGLISVLPPATLAGALLLTVCFGALLWLERPHRALLPATLLATVVSLHALPAVIETEPRFATAWQHLGFLDYIDRTGTAVPDLDARWSWPAFFAAVAFVARACGVDDFTEVVRWWPTAVQLLYLAPMFVLVRSMRAHWRAKWTGLWVFVLSAWVGQDYFSPQGFTYLLYLVFAALLLVYFRAPRVLWGKVRPGEAEVEPASRRHRAVLLAVVVALYAACVPAHQLTPFMMLGLITALVLLGKSELRGLPLLFGVMVVAWIGYMAEPYWSGHFDDLFGGVGGVGSNVQSSVSGRIEGGSDTHKLVLYTRVLLAGGVLACACWGFWRRRGKHYRERSLLALTFVPFLGFGMQSYGGEMALRIFLFALPGAALLMGLAFFPRAEEDAAAHEERRRAPGARRVRAHLAPAAALTAGLVLMVGFLIARWGNEPFERVRTGEVAAMEYVYAHDEPTVRLLWLSDDPATTVTPSIPWGARDMEKVEYVPTQAPHDPVLVSGLVKALRDAGPNSYLMVNRGQVTFLELDAGYPESWDDRLLRNLDARDDLRKEYANEDAVLYALAEQPPGDVAEAAPGPPGPIVTWTAWSVVGALAAVALVVLLTARETIRVAARPSVRKLQWIQGTFWFSLPLIAVLLASVIQRFLTIK